jgi:phosphocarrier protein
MARGTHRRCRLRHLLDHAVTAERTLRVVNENGIHARPAAEIVKTAAKFRCDITLARDGLEVNGKSIMGVMMLAAECGSEILARATGDDAEAALDALAHVVSMKFGES